MSYNRQAIADALAKMNKARKPKQPKDIIKDPEGQYKYPGVPTRIPSNEITMQGVPYPVLGVDNLGNQQMMIPEADYIFPGNYVDEYPMAKYGGLVTGLTNTSGNLLMNKKGKRMMSQSGSLSATNQLFLGNPLVTKRKRSVFVPGAPFQEGGQKPPIYVDPNDPAGRARYQAYQDSLSLVNAPFESFKISQKADALLEQQKYEEARKVLNSDRYNIPSYKAYLRLTQLNSEKPTPIKGSEYGWGLNPSDPASVRFKKPTQPVKYKPNPEIIAKQQQLIDAGFDIGKADGIWGPKSKAAWEEFQAQQTTTPEPEVIEETTEPEVVETTPEPEEITTSPEVTEQESKAVETPETPKSSGPRIRYHREWNPYTHKYEPMSPKQKHQLDSLHHRNLPMPENWQPELIEDWRRQSGGNTSDPGMDAMMKARFAYAHMHGNPAAQRMTYPVDNPYTFTGYEPYTTPDMAGAPGTHYMFSQGNYAVPTIQQDGYGNLMYNPEANYTNSEAIQFDRPEDAEYFAKYYKQIAPGMQTGGSTDWKSRIASAIKFQQGGQKDRWGRSPSSQWYGFDPDKKQFTTKDQWGRSAGSEWYGFDPETKQYTLGNKAVKKEPIQYRPLKKNEKYNQITVVQTQPAETVNQSRGIPADKLEELKNLTAPVDPRINQFSFEADTRNYAQRERDQAAAKQLTDPDWKQQISNALQTPLFQAGNFWDYISGGDDWKKAQQAYNLYQLNPYTQNKFSNFVNTALSNTGNALMTGMEIADGYALARAVPGIQSQVGKYLTTKRPLKNAYKINPRALKADDVEFLWRWQADNIPQSLTQANAVPSQYTGKWFQKGLPEDVYEYLKIRPGSGTLKGVAMPKGTSTLPKDAAKFTFSDKLREIERIIPDELLNKTTNFRIKNNPWLLDRAHNPNFVNDLNDLINTFKNAKVKPHWWRGYGSNTPKQLPGSGNTFPNIYKGLFPFIFGAAAASQYQQGGSIQPLDYFDAELTDEEIEQYKKGGCTIVKL